MSQDYWRAAGPRVISRAGAYERGIGRAQVDAHVRSGRWRLVLPGVYLTRPEYNRVDLGKAALLYAGGRSSLSGGEALWFYGILSDHRSQMLVLSNRDRRPPSAWVRVRSTLRLPTPVHRNGVRLAPVARAVVDHAHVTRRLDDVRAVVARAVQRQLCTVDQLVAELEAGQQRGSAHLRVALAEVDHGAASAPEARAGAALRKAKLGPFEQNVRINGPDGSFFVVDFLWRDRRAVLEIDSVQYHFEAQDWARTMSRHRELEALGYSVIHMRPAELSDEASFVQAVSRWLASRPRS